MILFFCLFGCSYSARKHTSTLKSTEVLNLEAELDALSGSELTFLILCICTYYQFLLFFLFFYCFFFITNSGNNSNNFSLIFIIYRWVLFLLKLSIQSFKGILRLDTWPLLKKIIEFISSKKSKLFNKYYVAWTRIFLLFPILNVHV